MGFRTLEISKPSEVHVNYGQLIIKQENNEYSIPLEDLECLICSGPNIRLSTMALSRITGKGIGVLIIDETFKPSAIVNQYTGNSRQSHIMHAQIKLSDRKKALLWNRIIKQKLQNQNDALKIMGYSNKDYLFKEINDCSIGNEEICESIGAKKYFYVYQGGVKRRMESPINSRLNYGYAVVRNAIIRCLIVHGFHPTIGINHSSQLNPFNLADDLIEPLRPMIDIVADSILDEEIHLSKNVRKKMANSLFCKVKMSDSEIILLYAIDKMVKSLRDFLLKDEVTGFIMPSVIPLLFEEKIEE